LAASGSPYAGYLPYWNDAGGLPLLDRLLYADAKTYLVELLMKQDRMSMACSIESRVPFLDHEFVEFAAGVPHHMKIRGNEAKYILKKAVEDVLPHEIIYRRKMGFPTPLRAWLADDRSGALLRSLTRRDGLLAGYVDHAALTALLERHRAGTVDATDRIWRLLNLQLWGDLYVTGNKPPEARAALGARG
jgi:asparagine synthase (glutamine-hydrolysing)